MKIEFDYTNDVIYFIPTAFICYDEDINLTYFGISWLGLYLLIYKEKEE